MPQLAPHLAAVSAKAKLTRTHVFALGSALVKVTPPPAATGHADTAPLVAAMRAAKTVDALCQAIMARASDAHRDTVHAMLSQLPGERDLGAAPVSVAARVEGSGALMDVDML